ncbi:hypothetical protein HMPREF1544_03055 [Mucor circinelloides 1006PhL]|uniref:Uncharacterized protein n=1 Tax=Mucor circinelloides f. circinelloides (strain 1006PhL) TaxID=1220926 RepID=S2JJH3_MUCC1|nr:hypothetical protein HMPREF1544_03055 [Mucor circinelloides 1006PhL]KAG1115820.1 hypothetical protein G6F42_013848 [Rhizopus arrhizus]
MHNNLGPLLAAQVNRFSDAYQYKLWEKNFTRDIEMQKTDLDKAEATRFINQYAPKLIECVKSIDIFDTT